ncbi:hypothetical protein BH18VER1_BH18VER1_22290 [soil metagenome]
MDEWADKVYDIVQRDLAAQPLAALKPLRETQAASEAWRKMRELVKDQKRNESSSTQSWCLSPGRCS